MRRQEFLEKYKISEEYEEWFISTRAFTNDLKVNGWKINEPKQLFEFHSKFNELDIICTNPNFYKDGEIIGNSRKSSIMASGMFRFTYEGKQYTDFYVFLKENGVEALNNLDKIQWDEIMDWLIVDKKTGMLKAQFDDWDNCPTRKEVEQ
tara:strand:- start:458 stop:907 length:450 start_codon:yes stop_codon:yes gene_type:complete